MFCDNSINAENGFNNYVSSYTTDKPHIQTHAQKYEMLQDYIK